MDEFFVTVGSNPSGARASLRDFESILGLGGAEIFDKFDSWETCEIISSFSISESKFPPICCGVPTISISERLPSSSSGSSSEIRDII